MIDDDDWDSDRCCSEDFGGSHYHCAGCGKVTGMMGCGTRRDGSMVCQPPGDRKNVVEQEDEDEPPPTPISSTTPS